MYKILENSFNNLDKNNNPSDGKYLVQTHSQAKTMGTKLPEIHGVEKNLNPNLRPEKQHTISKQGRSKRLQMGQGRAGSKRGKPDPINQSNKPTIIGVTRNSRKNQNSNRENKQHTQYRQHE